MTFFTGRSLASKACKAVPCGLRRLWSDCANAQTDLSLRSPHMLECMFSYFATGVYAFFVCRVVYH